MGERLTRLARIRTDRPSEFAPDKHLSKVAPLARSRTIASRKMSSRPLKRAKTNHHLVPVGPSVVKLLTRLSKGGLANLALGWATNPSTKPPATHRSSDEETDSDQDAQSSEEAYAVLRDSKSSTKAELVERIERDWVSTQQHRPRQSSINQASATYLTLFAQSDGLSHTQLAQAEVLGESLPKPAPQRSGDHPRPRRHLSSLL